MFKYKMILDNMLSLNNDVLGPIHRVDINHSNYYSENEWAKLYSGNDFPLYYSIAFSKNPDLSDNFIGGGASLNKDKAMVKAIGECMERYSSFYPFFDPSLLISRSLNQIKIEKKNFISPFDLVGYPESFYADKTCLFSFNDDSVINWIQCKQIDKAYEVYIPAQKILLGEVENEVLFDITISTGTACGDNLTQALTSAILEVVERDSFMLTWMFKIPSKKIILQNINNVELDKLYSVIVNNLNATEKLNIYDISKTKGIYTFLAIITNNIGVTNIVSSASGLNAEKLIIKLLEELCMTYRHAYNLYATKSPINKIEDVKTLDDHLRYYFDKNQENFNFINSDNQTVELNSFDNYEQLTPQDEIDYMCMNISLENHEAFYTDISHDYFKKCGFTIVKVVISGYVGLDIHSGLRWINNTRVDSFKMKYGPHINNEPHPFP